MKLQKIKGFLKYHLIDKPIHSRKYNLKMIATFKIINRERKKGITYDDYFKLVEEMKLYRDELTREYEDMLNFLKFDNKLIDKYNPYEKSTNK